MIAADELPEVSTDHMTRDSIVEIKSFEINDDEQVNYDFLDAQLDGLASNFQGEMFTASISAEVGSPTIVGALKQAWERGGWQVGVFEVDNGWQVVFVKPRVPIGKAIASALESRARAAAPASPADRAEVHAARTPDTSTPLLVRMPTRGRPDQALRVLSLYRSAAVTNPKIEVVLDHDDQTMNNSRVLQRLCELDCIVTFGAHRNKIDAVNGGRVDDWAVLALASDDMRPVVNGYDRKMLDAMDRHFPLRDGVVYFDDGYNKDHVRPGEPVLCTMPIMGRHLWEEFGYVYHPEYGSLYSDDEQTKILTAMKRLQFVDQVIVEHRHHAAGKAVMDTLYQFNDNKWGLADRELFEKRSALRKDQSQFAFDAPPMWLSILICSTPERSKMLTRLVDYLRHQVRPYRRQVELVVDATAGGEIGDKRQRLLERAVGHYVAFIDDDDWVPSDYVRRVVEVLASRRPDCASLVGILTTNGERPERFEHSIQNDGWYTRNDGVHIRTPNHLNAVRRELALQAGFRSMSFGEDHDYSNALRPLLKTEASTGEEPLYYYWFRSKERMGA